MTTPTGSSPAAGTAGCQNERNEANDVTQRPRDANDEVVYIFIFHNKNSIWLIFTSLAQGGEEDRRKRPENAQTVSVHQNDAETN